MFIYPVILTVPGGASESAKRRDKITQLGRYARQSLRLSGEYSGFYPEYLLKDKDGRPIPYGDIYWSISHKLGCVAGIVSRSGTGIDIEKIKPVSDSLFKRICSADERKLFKQDDYNLAFFRSFTSKEAVLKLLGTGLKGMGGVKIVEAPDSSNTILMYLNYIYRVEHFMVNGYLVSVVKENSTVLWNYIDPSI